MAQDERVLDNIDLITLLDVKNSKFEFKQSNLGFSFPCNICEHVNVVCGEPCQDCDHQ